MNINVIIENKIKYEMGQLYNYLNEIENTYISPHITGENLVKFFNLNATYQYGHWRCVCPFTKEPPIKPNLSLTITKKVLRALHAKPVELT